MTRPIPILDSDPIDLMLFRRGADGSFTPIRRRRWRPAISAMGWIAVLGVVVLILSAIGLATVIGWIRSAI